METEPADRQMETPVQSEKVREKAFQLCKEYLQGAWKLVSAKQLEIRQISGGLSNLVFYVGLPGSRPEGGREPTCILLRLFGELSQTPAHQYRMVTETVVFTMLAERNLGPRLFGVFPGGRLEEFIPGHPLTSGEMRSPQFGGQIARNVALVHSLEVPVSKEPTWLVDTMRSYLHRLKVCPDKVPAEERQEAEELAGWDVRQEVDWLLSFLKIVDSPVVFSHNDINTGNILVREDPESWDPVVFIDYEFAAYNYRAFDIANHFNEWMYDYGRKDFPYYYRRTEQYPSQSEQERWVRMYVKTYREQQQLQEENNESPSSPPPPPPPPHIQESQILKEVAVFSLASHMVWCLWGLKQGQTSSIPFAYYHFARDKLEDYRESKARVESLLLQEKAGL